ncbi:hydrogenase expression/formation protein [Citrobacter freundii]|uniref:Hydrogenase expression/formation protein n=1 Tax=Citrobacter murliniae TaxID=67829 RepID=A0ABY2PTW3_9ENTR|nr:MULTISPECIES: hydrogenase expression/formation protein [Citrobacter]MCQ7061252.1 hydrogenase expression/formation protein [Escherichia coli]KLV67080.1 hydrogenase-1 operon protein HyaF [Citrobacter sp. MGH106]MDK2359175.1 hydrogenase expression/formation protein [Citrobacter freundii]MDM2942026.1 hydrogenase expression/formation protein [Citrobacter sp. Cm038]THE37525.1 hydrogenase expression/formation protein [Citrobacter murliniae]
MSDSFFHLLGPGTQPDDDSFTMNPLPLTCQVNSAPSMAALESCQHSPTVMALLAELRKQLTRRIPAKEEVLGWDLSALNADDLTFLNTLLGEGEVSARIQHADGSESEIQESIFCGIWRIRRQSSNQQWEERLEAGSAPLVLWQAATLNTLPDDTLLPPPVDGLMNGLTLAQELLAHVRNPATQPHSINLTQLPISDADRLFLTRLCGQGHIQIRTVGYGESQIDATALRHVWHVRCLDTLKGILLDSYEICPLPELVQAAPEDLLDSLQRLNEVCGWLEGPPHF